MLNGSYGEENSLIPEQKKPVVMKLLRVMDLGCKLGLIKVNILIYNKTLDLMLVFPRGLDTEFNQTLDKNMHW